MMKKNEVWTDELRKDLWRFMTKKQTPKEIADHLGLEKGQISRDAVEKQLMKYAKDNSGFGELEKKVSFFKAGDGAGVIKNPKISESKIKNKAGDVRGSTKTVSVPDWAVSKLPAEYKKVGQRFSIKVTSSGTITLKPTDEEKPPEE